MAKLTTEERDIVIDALVENCACSEATDTDRDSFEALSDHALATLALNAGIVDGDEEGDEEEVEEEVEAPKKKKPVTTNSNSSMDEFRASLLAEVKDIVVNSMRESGTREKLVATITANARNTFTDKQLAAMDVSSLQAVAALAGGPVANAVKQPATKLNFAGSPGIVRNAKAEGKKSKPLVAPVMNFSSKTDDDE